MALLFTCPVFCVFSSHLSCVYGPSPHLSHACACPHHLFHVCGLSSHIMTAFFTTLFYFVSSPPVAFLLQASHIRASSHLLASAPALWGSEEEYYLRIFWAVSPCSPHMLHFLSFAPLPASQDFSLGN